MPSWKWFGHLQLQLSHILFYQILVLISIISWFGLSCVSCIPELLYVICALTFHLPFYEFWWNLSEILLHSPILIMTHHLPTPHCSTGVLASVFIRCFARFKYSRLKHNLSLNGTLHGDSGRLDDRHLQWHAKGSLRVARENLHENTDTHTFDIQTLIHIPLDKRTDQKKIATHGSVHGILWRLSGLTTRITLH